MPLGKVSCSHTYKTLQAFQLWPGASASLLGRSQSPGSHSYLGQRGMQQQVEGGLGKECILTPQFLN